jgi:hypothetical protein
MRLIGNGLIPDSDSTNRLSKKRALSPQGGDVNAITGGGSLKVPKIVKFGTRAHEDLVIRRESLWNMYDKGYELELGGTVTIAGQKVFPRNLAVVRAFLEGRAEKTLHIFQSIQHNNFAAALEVFISEEIFYVVLELMAISLDQLVASPEYPNQLMLAAIVGQVS